MTHPQSQDPLAAEFADLPPNGSRGRTFDACVCAAIALVASGLRFYRLGQLSFWYDEVVTMRLARSASVGELINRLFEIDATRAPLHPFVLQIWLRLLGTSEFAARSFSALCGIATVVLIYQIGRAAFDSRTGLWAAWLAALSPLLVVYSREARMYAWLVLVTCLCWKLLLDLRNSFTTARAAAYVFCLACLGIYSHPLGLLMLAAIAFAGLLDARTSLPLPQAIDCSGPRGGDADRSMAPQLLRSSTRVHERAPAASVPGGNADRFHRRQRAAALPWTLRLC